MKPPRRSGRRKSSGEPDLGFDGFHLLVKGTDAARTLVTAKNVVRKVFDRADAWRVTLLPASTQEFLLTPVDDSAAPSLPEAWEIARKLAAHPSVLDAEVALSVPGIEPPGGPDGLAPSEKKARGFPAKGGPKSLFGGAKKGAEEPDWSVKHVRAPEAWKIASAKGKGVLVGHPDTGYTLHPEIWSADPTQNRVRADLGHDFVDGGDPMDELVGSGVTFRFPGHGTATASVLMSGIGGEKSPAVTGIAPQAVLIPIRVSTSVIHLDFDRLVAGLRHAIAQGLHVVSMSLGGPIPSGTLERAVKDAVEAGIIVLAAAGNVYPFVVWPAAYDDVIAVAATNCERKPWRFSASGSAVDLSAPGESVWVARTERKKPYFVEQSSGTSHAVAATAGAAALWLSHHGREALMEKYGRENLARVFKQVLVTSGVSTPPPGWDRDRYGAGILDARALIEAPLPSVVPAAKKRMLRAVDRRIRTLHNFFPQVPAASVDRAVASLLKVSVARLPAALDDVGDELAVHLGVDPKLREEVLRRVADLDRPPATARVAGAVVKAKTKRVAPRAVSSAHVKRTASARLRRKLGVS